MCFPSVFYLTYHTTLAEEGKVKGGDTTIKESELGVWVGEMAKMSYPDTFGYNHYPQYRSQYFGMYKKHCLQHYKNKLNYSCM